MTITPALDREPAGVHEPTTAGAAETVVDRVRSWTRALVEGLQCSDDAERIDLLRALEELKCASESAQARTTVNLDASVRRTEAAAGVRAKRRGRGVAGQVGLARRCSPHRARRLIGLAKTVHAELPHTAAAWRAGRISEWRVMLIARETAAVTLYTREQIDREIAGDAERLEGWSDRQTVSAVLERAAELDAESLVARRRRAEADRRVSVRPAPDKMAGVTALLPLVDGVAVYKALSLAADAARAAGDERTRGQVMADTLVERITGHPAGQPHITIQLVMTDQALLGSSDTPARIPGFGVIPADLARALAARATCDEQARVRRLFTDPAGHLVAMESATRRVPPALAEFITIRDQTCRTPWCDARIRHIDHVTAHAEGGSTTAANLQGLCEACNYIKDAHLWSARPTTEPGPWGAETTTPTGHRHTTHPDPWPRPRRLRRRPEPVYPPPPHPLSRLRPRPHGSTTASVASADP